MELSVAQVKQFFTQEELRVLHITEDATHIRLRPKIKLNKSMFKLIARKVQDNGGEYEFSNHYGGHFRILKKQRGSWQQKL